MKKIFTPCLAIVVIGVLEATALFLGYDGILFGGAVALIAGIGGYSAKKGN